MKKTTKTKAVRAQATGEGQQSMTAYGAALSGSLFQGLSVRDAIPKDWKGRAEKAMEYYQQEPLVANCINAWRSFALGDEIGLACEDEAVLDEAQTMFWELGLNTWVKDMISQLLVKGECVGYMMPAKTGTAIEKVQCVNPLSMEYEYKDDMLIAAVQRPITKEGSPGDEINLSIDNMIVVKWNAPEFEPRGNSMVLPAFEAIELLRDYRRAERAIAKRWTTPLRFIQVGGYFGQKLILPDQARINKLRDEMDKMDLRNGLVVPFDVKAETYGIDASFNTDEKIKQTKQDILVALGMSQSLVTGDGPNFATASISMQKMIVQLKEIKQVARDLLDWVFDTWLSRIGKEELQITYDFSDLDLSAEVDQKRVLIDLYDRGLISKDTLQKKMGLAPDVEARQKEDEEVVVDTNWTIDDITKLVGLEILTADEARLLLGLGGEGKPTAEEAAKASRMKDVLKIYARNPRAK